MKAKIRFAYRYIIEESSVVSWDRYVFEDTYKEYLIQHQKFNNPERPATTFRELLSMNEKAEKLHYLIGLAVNHYVEQLKGSLYRVPDVLGNNYLPIEGYKTDIVNTDIHSISKHKIGITFFSPEMMLLDILNQCYLVSKNTEDIGKYETLMFREQPNLSICYFESL